MKKTLLKILSLKKKKRVCAEEKNQTQPLPTANMPLDIQKPPKKYLVTNHPVIQAGIQALERASRSCTPPAYCYSNRPPRAVGNKGPSDIGGGRKAVNEVLEGKLKG